MSDKVEPVASGSSPQFVVVLGKEVTVVDCEVCQ
jgi:hypothetical protein